MLSSLAKCKPHGAGMIDRAPLAIVVVGDPTLSDTWVEDCSIASIFLQLAATDLGLGSCWVQVDKRDFSASISADNYIKQLLNIPEQKTVLAVIAIGYPEAENKPIGRQRDHSSQVHYDKF
jgi:nitroreductase